MTVRRYYTNHTHAARCSAPIGAEFVAFGWVKGETWQGLSNFMTGSDATNDLFGTRHFVVTRTGDKVPDDSTYLAMCVDADNVAWHSWELTDEGLKTFKPNPETAKATFAKTPTAAK